MKAKYMLC